MTTESLIITVPDLGGAEQVEVIEILVSEGEEVDSEQSVYTLETDKASMEIPAGQAGRIGRVLLKLGDKVSMGDAMLEMEVSDVATDLSSEMTGDIQRAGEETVQAHNSKQEVSESEKAEERIEQKEDEQREEQKKEKKETAASDSDENSPTSNEVHAGPAVRKFARELGVDLGLVQGTGSRDRVTRDDVQTYVKAQLSQPSVMGSGAISGLMGSGIPKVPEIDFTKFGEVESQPLNKIKLLTAKSLTAAWLNAPQVTQFDQVNITDLEAFRKQVNAKPNNPIKLSIVPFVMKALATAMKEFPQFNSSLSADGQSLIYKKYTHIGVAVDTLNGLLVPVIRDVDKKSVMEIAIDLNEKAEKARLGKLGLTDMQGGCISVSSLGGIGGTAFTPIVNAPEVAILGLSKSEIKPLWQASGEVGLYTGEFVPALMLPLSLSYDHRVIDGAEAARFSQYLTHILGDIRQLVL